MSPPGLGITLGISNVFVIALGIGAMLGRHDMGGVALWIVMVGIIPAMIAGAFLGWLAGGMSSHPRWLRLLVLTVPAVLVVFSLAAEFGMLEFALVSCIPTLVATLLLERGTRENRSPPLPIARTQ